MQLIIDESKTSQELTRIDNIAKVKKQIAEHLAEDRFNYIITADNIKETKKANTEFNKTRDYIKNILSVIVERETESVTKLKEVVKELLTGIEAKRAERVKAIEVYESKTKELLTKLLLEFREQNAETVGLRKEFDDISILDLVKLANITASERLSKAAKDGVISKIQKALNLQNRYDLRLSSLKNVCYENGLSESLESSHVQGIIFIDSEDEYQEKLKNLISSEIARYEKIKENIAKQEKEKAELVARENTNKLVKAQLEDKYLQRISTASKQDIENIQQEIVNYSSDVLIDINTAISNRINAIYFEEQNSKTEVQVVEEVKQVEPQQQEEPQNHVQQVQTQQQTPPTEDGKKIVNIQVGLKFIVKNKVPSEMILQRVEQMLRDAGLNESIDRIEIV